MSFVSRKICRPAQQADQKRVVEFGEQLCMDVLKKVPHRHFVARALQGIRVAPPLELKKLLVPFRVEAIFQHKVFKMLLKKGKITKEMIAMLSTIGTLNIPGTNKFKYSAISNCEF